MRIYVKNSKNVQLELSEYNGFALTDVQGLSPAPSNVNITKTAGGDGSIFNSAMIPQRNIVLTLYVLPNIEAHRNALYAFFAPNSVITLLISTGTRTARALWRVLTARFLQRRKCSRFRYYARSRFLKTKQRKRKP